MNIVENKKGFTLVELLIVIAVLGALASVFLLSFPSAQRRARDTQRRTDLKQYQALIEIFATNNNHTYPATSGNLTGICPDLNLAGNLCVDDPHNTILYQYAVNAATTAYVVWAQLENPDIDGNTEFFIACSNGLTGEDSVAPAGACPF